MEQQHDTSWPETFWEEFEGLLTRRFEGHTKAVYATESNTMVVVWRGPLPASVEVRFRPLAERGDLELVRFEPDVLDHAVRHLATTLERGRLAEVDVPGSVAATRDAGRLVLLVGDVRGDTARVRCVVGEQARDYGLGLDLRLGRPGPDLSR